MRGIVKMRNNKALMDSPKFWSGLFVLFGSLGGWVVINFKNIGIGIFLLYISTICYLNYRAAQYVEIQYK